MMSKRLEILEMELENMRKSHSSQWDTYGSELCAGDMINQEEDLIKKINKIKEEEEVSFIEDASQIIDN